MTRDSVKITEIFLSLQGETSTVGLPTVFVRLTGCPLRCHYCDTEYAFYGGERWAIDDVLLEVSTYDVRHITVTGGEPLAQKECLPLLTGLCDAGYRVSLETSGAMDVSGVDPRVAIILDLKTPGSGEMHRNRYQNIHKLKPGDEVKFVICDQRDYQWARMRFDDLKLSERVDNVLFSPSHGQLNAADLAGWILEDKLPVRMQVQLHKFIWGDLPGH